MIATTDTLSPTIALAAGCYWGTEKFIVKDFQKRFPNSIRDAKVGFMNPTETTQQPKKKGPSYKQVCSGATGYVEVLNVTLNNPSLLPELIQFFFMFHDPTTKNRQGNDVGTQYASAIFVNDTTQRQIATNIKEELQLLINQRQIKSYSRAHVETKIYNYTHFYAAHLAHQDYLTKHPFGYCNHRYRFRDWPKLKTKGSSSSSSSHVTKKDDETEENEDEPQGATTGAVSKKKTNWGQRLWSRFIRERTSGANQ